MANTDGKRAYVRSNKVYYAHILKPDDVSVSVGIYHPDGGTSGEFTIRWHDLRRANLCARLEAFEDSWNVLHLHFQDLLAKMAEAGSREIQESEFCKLLDSLGIVDITEYEQGKPANDLRKV